MSKVTQLPAADPDVIREQLKRPIPREHRKVGGQVTSLVVDAERVDREWEDEEAERKRQEWDEETRPQLLGQRRAARERLSLGKRLDEVAGALAERAGGMRARPIAAGSRSAEGSPTGNRPPGGTNVDRSVDDAMILIRAHVRGLEAALDAEDGLLVSPPEGARPGAVGGPVGARMMTTSERDRIVWEDFQGVRSEQVAREAPYLGTSARTIERARVNEANRRRVRVSPVTGVVTGELDGPPLIAA